MKYISLFLLSLCAILSNNALADTYKGVFTKDNFNYTTEAKTVVVNDVEWTTKLTREISSSRLTQNGNAVKFGTEDDTTSVILTSSGFNGTITKVTLCGRLGSKKKGKISVSAGGEKWNPETFTSTTTSTEHSFTGEGSGTLIITFSPVDKSALYLDYIEVEYTPSYVTPKSPTFLTEPGTFTRGFNLYMSCETEGAEIYYTTDGTTPSDKSNLYTSGGIVISNTTTVKAVAIKDGIKSSVVEGTYTYEPITGKYRYYKETNTDGLQAGCYYIIVSEYAKKIMGAYNATNNERKSTSYENTYSDYIELKKADIATISTDNTRAFEFLLGGETDAWTFQDVTDGNYVGGTHLKLQNYKEVTAESQATIQFTSNKNANITFNGCVLKCMNQDDGNAYFRTTSSSGGLVTSLYRRMGRFTITAAGYATLYSDEAYIMPDGVCGAIITNAAEDGKLTIDYKYTSGTVVPAGSALLLKGEAGDYKAIILRSELTADVDNLLHGSEEDALTAVDGAKAYYKLSFDSEGYNLGFYWDNETGSAFTSKGGMCYLALPSTIATIRQGYPFCDMNITGIHSATLSSRDKTDAVYTIDGQRKSIPPTHGLYIEGGKKYIKR